MPPFCDSQKVMRETWKTRKRIGCFRTSCERNPTDSGFPEVSPVERRLHCILCDVSMLIVGKHGHPKCGHEANSKEPIFCHGLTFTNGRTPCDWAVTTRTPATRANPSGSMCYSFSSIRPDGTSCTREVCLIYTPLRADQELKNSKLVARC